MPDRPAVEMLLWADLTSQQQSAVQLILIAIVLAFAIFVAQLFEKKPPKNDDDNLMY